MIIFDRTLRLRNLLKQKNFFLFGPRSTGKSFLIRHSLPESKIYDLLDMETYTRLLRRPKIIGEEIGDKEAIIVIDEIQKLPSLLDEVHRLIETKGVKFLLTGSSARKLKRHGSNLLGGRAWQALLFPLTTHEIPDFSLLTYLNRGGIPHIYLSKNYHEELRAYSSLYLREEITAEALVRKIDNFIRFLDVFALQNGEELNFQGVSSDAGVPVRTVQNYVEILEDTLIGFQIPGFLKTKKRKSITRSKFFFFDLGVTNALANRGEIKDKSELFGKCFEHFMILELRAYLNYKRLFLPLQYWRSTSGMEVDCIVGDRLALEFKSSDLVSEKHLRGLRSLREEQLIEKYIVVSQDPEPREIDGISILPWQNFLESLWSNTLIKNFKQ